MSAQQRELLPDISGNVINGLGETTFRRPRVVYWPNDGARSEGKEFGSVSEHPFGRVINWFRRQTPAVKHVYTDSENRAPKDLDSVAEVPVNHTLAGWTTRVKDFVLENEGELVGICKLDPDWFYDEMEVPDLSWVVVIGCKMDYDKFKHVPPSTENAICAIEVGEIYNKVDRAAGKLANWIRAQGWYAENQGGPNSGQMTLIPAAIGSSLGELGKHGSIINRQFGSMVRLSAVRTNLPLMPDSKDIFGADDFCMKCQACTKACPVDAISDEKQTVRGTKKWYVNFDKCMPYFNENYACGICLAICPWGRPGTAPKLIEMVSKWKTQSKV